jgi:hypothetical protein
VQQPEASPAAPAGFVQTLAGLYTSPTETFRSIVSRPTFLAPFLILMFLTVGFTALWMSKVDPVAFMREQIEQSPRAADMPPEQKEQVIQTQAKFFKYFAVMPAIVVPIFYLLTSLLYLAIFRFLYGADLTFKQSLAIVLWAFLAVSLVSTPLMVAVFALKGDWNLDPNSVLQANLSLILDKATAPKWLYSLLSSIDLFSFWIMALLAAGYGVASRRTMGGAFAGVAAPWIFYVLIKVGFAALMG